MDEEKLTEDLVGIKALLELKDGFLSFDESCVVEAVKELQNLLNQYLEVKGFALPEDEPGQASSCGHIFEHGDVIYRCKDCTHDDTCVLCSKCFNDDDHVGHRISFSVSKGSGGSCDCGEDESWNRPLHCPLHQGQSESSCDFPERDEVLFKFFYHTFHVMMPFLVAPYPTMNVDLASAASLNQVLSLVLFNDEKHSYDDVITVLHHSTMLSGHPNAERTPEHYAKTIDHYGIASLGEDINRNLLAAAATIRTIGLKVEAYTLEHARSWIFTHYFVAWLDAIVENHAVLRGPLIRALIEQDDSQHSYLEKILLADIYLTKGLRVAFNTILVKCALSDGETKQAVGVIYGACFPAMLEVYIQGDREPEHSLVHFSVQLFTVSSVITSLVMEDRFYEEICSIAQSYFQESPHLVEQLPKTIQNDISMLLSVLRYVFKDPSIKNAGFFNDPVNFLHFADAFIEPLEGFNPQIRQLDTHVLFESRKWTASFTVQIQVCEVLFLYLDSIEDLDTAEKIIELLIDEYTPSTTEFSLHSPLVTCVSFLIRKIFQLSESNSRAIAFIRTLMRKPTFDNFFKASVKMIRFSSEIEAGLWVRNGLSMPSQLHLFKYSPYRFYFWDAAICFLKSSLICTPLNVWLEMVRSSWPQELNEVSPISPIAFEFSRSLIAVLYGVSFAWLTNENLVAESVAALLFSGPYSFSDLEQLLPEQWVTLDCFSADLAKYSKAKIGDELGDHVFDVDRHEFGKFCPFYFLYSPEARETAMERLAKESPSSEIFMLSFEKASPLSMTELSLLSSQPISESLVTLMHSLLKSDIKSHLSLGLALICLLLPRQDLVPFIADFSKKISDTSRKFIRCQLNQLAGISVAQLDLALCENGLGQKNLAGTEAKRRALERINVARKGFLEASAPLGGIASLEAGENETDSTDYINSDLKYSCCVICQASTDKNSPMGILGFLRSSHIDGCSFLFSSCMHVIHLDCFKGSLAKSKVVACPLCSTVSNFYLAVDSMELGKVDSGTLSHSSYPFDDVVNWIKSGHLDLLYRRNNEMPESAKDIENYQYSYNSFVSALEKNGLTSFSAAQLIGDLFVRLKLLRNDKPRFVCDLESVRKLLRALKIWFSLELSSRFSDEILEIVGTFKDQDLIRAETSLSGTITCLIFNSGEETLNFASTLRLCQFAYFASIRNMILKGSLGKDLDVYDDANVGLLQDLYLAMINWFDLPIISLDNALGLAEGLNLQAPKPSLIEELLLDAKGVFSQFFIQFKTSSPPAIKFCILEERYDKLLTKYSAITCTGCNQRPISPAVCLLCGALICASSYCCFDENRGECNSHAQRCGKNGGIFLILRKNSVLLLGSRQFGWGKIFNSPYLDEYGQTDPGLRRGKLLWLDYGRLEFIRKKWELSAFDSEIFRTEERFSVDWTSF